jgi:predicted amidohydrolase
MRAALVQMRCEKGDLAGNLAQSAAHIARAGERGIDIVCFPEMSLTGYIDPTTSPNAVLELDGPEVATFLDVTRGRSPVVIAGLVERNPDGKPFITQIVARDGELLGVYRKRTIVDEEAEWFAPGDEPSLVVRAVPLPFAVTVCADVDDPALFAECARRGARVVFEAAAPGLYGEQATRDWAAGFDWWRGECHDKLGQYARENGLWIAVATQAGRTVDEDFPGGGYLFDPDGRCVAETADWTEGVLEVEVPADG